MADRAHAHITKINAGHLSLISHPGSGGRSDPRRGPRHRLARCPMRQPFGTQ
jgi:hypothetical protein